MLLSEKGRLRAARKRCEPLRFRVNEELQFETSPRMSLVREASGGEVGTVVASTDRYGFPVRLGLCRETGLLYLIDRLTPEAYARFYSSGLYRELIDTFWGTVNVPGESHGPKVRLGAHHAQASRNARNLVMNLRGIATFRQDQTLLDIGGSTGIQSLALQEEFGVKATVLDPATEELATAEKNGLSVRLGLVEDVEFAEGERFDIILLNQTIEHIIDMKATFAKIAMLLREDGYVLFDCLDFMSETRLRGTAEAVSRLDHCHFLYDEMVPTFLKRVGLELVWRNRISHLSTLYICRKAEPDLNCTLPEHVYAQTVRTLFDLGVSWTQMPRVESWTLVERVRSKLGLPNGET